ncbi:MAG TPA: phospholipase D family protein [Pyrinomonadaceae bacterium]|jgi:HKD family nuclease
MRITTITQFAGHNSVGEILKELLADNSKEFHAVKFLMAFVNLSGLSYIRDSIEDFYDDNGTLEFIIGLDNGVTTYEALKYLNARFPRASLFLFQDQSAEIIFHPKVIILEGRETTVCIVGSANLTLGGLHSNFEGAVMLEADNQDDEEHVRSIATLWDTFRHPKPPLSSAHIQELNGAWLSKNRSKFSTRKDREQENKKRRKSKFSGFGAVKFKRPKLSPPPPPLPVPPPPTPTVAVPPPTSPTAVRTPASGQKLYLEILSETREGNQVQLPRAVVTSYFRGSLTRPKHLRLSVDGAPYREVSIAHFANNTHRISINELTGVPRPAMAVFTRDAGALNSYTCEILTGRGYDAALTRCTEQTRAGSRRWGVESIHSATFAVALRGRGTMMPSGVGRPSADCVHSRRSIVTPIFGAPPFFVRR